MSKKILLNGKRIGEGKISCVHELAKGGESA
jgi:hypothetical protein